MTLEKRSQLTTTLDITDIIVFFLQIDVVDHMIFTALTMRVTQP